MKPSADFVSQTAPSPSIWIYPLDTARIGEEGSQTLQTLDPSDDDAQSRQNHEVENQTASLPNLQKAGKGHRRRLPLLQ